MNPRKQSVSVRVILPNTDRGHIIGVLSGDSVLLQNAIYISRFCGYSFCLKPAFIFRFQTVCFLSAACLFVEIQVRRYGRPYWGEAGNPTLRVSEPDSCGSPAILNW